MVERFNGRIADVLKTHRFNSREDMEQTLLRYVALYNHQLPQSALKSSTPMQAMKEWYQTHPHCFTSVHMIVRDATVSIRSIIAPGTLFASTSSCVPKLS